MAKSRRARASTPKPAPLLAAAPKPSLIFGYEKDRPACRPIGFAPAGPVPVAGSDAKAALVSDDTESHVLVAAPTGSGKSRNFLIPNLLHWKSSVIVVDPKGECAMTTAAYRRDVLGQQVVILDPFSIASDGSDAMNPLEPIWRQPEYSSDAASALAHTMMGPHYGLSDPFWDLGGIDINSGCFVHAAHNPDPARRTLGTVWELLTRSDFDYSIATLCDSDPDLHPFARQQFHTYLAMEEQKVRPSVMSTARQHMRIFASSAVQRSVARTTFSLGQLRDGGGVTIYLVLPPDKLQSHATLLRLWLTTLLGVVTTRQVIPEQPTLFVVDELGTLGPLPAVLQAVTLLRGFGVRVVLMVQSLSQLRAFGMMEYQTLVENCQLITTFGRMRPPQAEELVQTLGDISNNALCTLARDEIVFSRAGGSTRTLTKMDYLADPGFKGRFAPNPYYAAAARRG